MKARKWVSLAKIIGFYMGFVSFILGMIPGLLGLQSLIEVLLYRKKWLHVLKEHSMHSRNEKENMTVVQANIVTAEKTIDSITGYPSYKILLEYYLDRKEPYHLTLDETLPTASRIAYYETKGRKSIQVHLTQDKKAIPTTMYQKKIDDLMQWARIMDPIVAIVGLTVYFFLCWLYINMTWSSGYIFGVLVALSFLSPLLMTPAVLVESRLEHEERLDLLVNDPIKLLSNFDLIKSQWYSLGPTMTRKIYPVLFFIGLINMTIHTTIFGLIPGSFCVWSLARWTDFQVARQRQTLIESFKEKSKRVKGYVVASNFPKSLKHDGNYTATLEYQAPTGHSIIKNIQTSFLKYHTVKEAAGRKDEGAPIHITSKESNFRMPIDVLVLSDNPLSGYPEEEIKRIATLKRYKRISAISAFAYLYIYNTTFPYMLLYSDVENEALDYVINDLILFWSPPLLCIILMMPQAYYSFHRIPFRKLLKDIYESGAIVADENVMT